MTFIYRVPFKPYRFSVLSLEGVRCTSKIDLNISSISYKMYFRKLLPLYVNGAVGTFIGVNYSQGKHGLYQYRQMRKFGNDDEFYDWGDTNFTPPASEQEAIYRSTLGHRYTWKNVIRSIGWPIFLSNYIMESSLDQITKNRKL